MRIPKLNSIPRPSGNTIKIIAIVSLAILNLHAYSYCLPHLPKDDFYLDEFRYSADVYHAPQVFRLNYADMEKNFRVYIYPDDTGDNSKLHRSPTQRSLRSFQGKYASEDYFFQNVAVSHLRTYDPDRAHLFFVPISCHKLRGQGKSLRNITHIVQNYVESLISKYPYWNRTLGADHFFVACHDVGLKSTKGVPLMVKNSIRVVCSAGYNVGYIPHKDVPLPQVMESFALHAGGDDIKNRTTLGFWGGHRNSKIRDTLVRLWQNDTEFDIQNNMMSWSPYHFVYQEKLYRAKFCICPGVLQGNNARISTSIHFGCVPVILSNYYDLPFSDILDWRKFSVILNERDVHQLKYILKNISEADYIALHSNLVKVQKHFRWNSNPVSFDAFHMVMYELWLRHYLIKY